MLASLCGACTLAVVVVESIFGLHSGIPLWTTDHIPNGRGVHPTCAYRIVINSQDSLHDCLTQSYPHTVLSHSLIHCICSLISLPSRSSARSRQRERTATQPLQLHIAQDIQSPLLQSLSPSVHLHSELLEQLQSQVYVWPYHRLPRCCTYSNYLQG